MKDQPAKQLLGQLGDERALELGSELGRGSELGDESNHAARA